MIQNDTLWELGLQAHEDSNKWFPAKAGDVFFNAACLAGEVGEVLNELKKVERGSCSYLAARPKVVDEMADVFTYLLSLAGSMNVDLLDEYNKKRKFNQERFGG